MVWLSHWHEDHFLHLDLFDDLPLWISEKDAPPLSDIEVFLDWYGIEDDAYRNDWRSILKDQFHCNDEKAFGTPDHIRDRFSGRG